MELRKVKTKKQIEETSRLANEIWHEHYSSIISEEQIDYMVDKFQSAEMITKQIKKEKYEYYNFVDNGKSVGYFGFVEQDGDVLFLSKIYLLKSERGKGFSRKAFEFLKEEAKSRGLSKIWLTVNKGNKHSIEIYKKFGMYIERTQIADIGEDFVMDDYVFVYDV